MIESNDYGTFITHDDHLFLPFKHITTNNFWSVFQFKDVVFEEEEDREYKKRPISIENNWMVFADTPDQASFKAYENYLRDDALTMKYETERLLIKTIFERIRELSIDNLDHFKVLYEPLQYELKKRSDESKTVNENKFFKYLLETIDTFYEMVCEIKEKSTLLTEENEKYKKKEKKRGKK